MDPSRFASILIIGEEKLHPYIRLLLRTNSMCSRAIMDFRTSAAHRLVGLYPRTYTAFADADCSCHHDHYAHNLQHGVNQILFKWLHHKRLLVSQHRPGNARILAG